MQKSGISENEQMLNKPIKTERWYDNQISVWHEFHIISEPQHFFFPQCINWILAQQNAQKLLMQTNCIDLVK